MRARMRIYGMRTGIIVEVSATDREQLAAIVADRNAPQKHVWAGAHRAADGGWLRHSGDHALHGHQQDGSLALAGAVHDRRHQRSAA